MGFRKRNLPLAAPIFRFSPDALAHLKAAALIYILLICASLIGDTQIRLEAFLLLLLASTKPPLSHLQSILEATTIDILRQHLDSINNGPLSDLILGVSTGPSHGLHLAVAIRESLNAICSHSRVPLIIELLSCLPDWTECNLTYNAF